MKLADDYISGLKRAYFENGGAKLWDRFERVIHGAGAADLDELRGLYPDVPESLIALLSFVDGTYFRAYQGEKITFYFLGSDVAEYPYYLLSARQIIENRNKAYEYYSDYVDRAYDEEDVEIDDEIIRDSSAMNWLHFSDCMNNGGSSQLFIDFSPSEKGTKGQIVRFLHDPDQIGVIAASFDEYLHLLMDGGYDFIQEDTLEE